MTPLTDFLAYKNSANVIRYFYHQYGCYQRMPVYDKLYNE